MRINRYVMGIIYSPTLLITAYLETIQARRILLAQSRGQADDEVVHEWEVPVGEEVDFEHDGWAKEVADTKPNVETDVAVQAVQHIRAEIAELKKMIEGLRVGAGEQS